MSVDEEEFFSDDLDDFLVDGMAVEGSPSESDSPRPAKKPRMETAKSRSSRNEVDEADEAESDDYGSDTDLGSFVDDDGSYEGTRRNDELSSPSQAYEITDAKGKRKAFVPKQQNTTKDNIFVTQLTQPLSPPEMLRGPRWQKPKPQPPRPASPAGDEFGDDDMEAALAASVQSFEQEQACNALSFNEVTPLPTRSLPGNQKTPKSTTKKKTDTPNASGDMFDELPDDAFDIDVDSLIANLPPPRPTPRKTSGGSFSSFNRVPRQTTLHDMVARNPASTSPPGEKSWYPPEKHGEKPTHHKLVEDTLDTWIYPTNLGKTRDYQFNIAQRGLYHNLLVALPTGLGKTFIAATVMLNWYRWTKDAQIIFVAPTKPLVSQQVSACLGIAGIPKSQTSMLTGGTAPGIRAEEWQSKRVFFLTPQTLVNDLKTGIADPKRIVLVVVDEAHRATGGYAYVEVVKFLQRFNQSFRVLALTATPGAKVETVQEVIDGLNISKVEIRTEQSLDIRQYVHAKNIEREVFSDSEELILCKEHFSRALQPLVDKLKHLNVYWGSDPLTLTPYGLTKARKEWNDSNAGRRSSPAFKVMINTIITILASCAHSLDLLKYHGITPFYRSQLKFQSNSGGLKSGKYKQQLVQDENYKRLMSQVSAWTKHPEFIGHPKLAYLKEVVLNHFLDAGEGQDGNTQSSTRLMIFVHFRDSAEEVIRVLKRHEPLVRPHIFIGQSSNKDSDGMNQKTQLSVVQKFKEGVYNTIVATSIGEEGLDIGEVDRIICYDSSSSPIRMLQRMGRTGRKRAGNIVILLTQGKEEQSYLKATDGYEKMQEMITSGKWFTYHTDLAPRILPPGVRPVVNKQKIDIPTENENPDLPEPKKRRNAPKKPPKKFHMPDNVETGFTRASDLAPGGATRKSKPKGRPKERTPTPGLADVPAPEDVLLTAEQQDELDQYYGNIGETSPQFARPPRNDAFPKLQSVSRPTKAVTHGSVTHRMIGALQKINQLGTDCEARFQKVLSLESQRPPEDALISRTLPPSRHKRKKGSNDRSQPSKPLKTRRLSHEVCNNENHSPSS
ncbi:3'-5' DNA helicase [Aspergillus melleus]|uniref:3'-5' DNA helicase n=1 Tax=Aspergillus melleus TaxID=138277 RepID=UPI001E8EC6A9|nr:3'-5' DNA helicase [Aspergillus melleus]KAH8431834.1 3'-5' DNA helicase [Aspergillus melleus]